MAQRTPQELMAADPSADDEEYGITWPDTADDDGGLDLSDAAEEIIYPLWVDGLYPAQITGANKVRSKKDRDQIKVNLVLFDLQTGQPGIKLSTYLQLPQADDPPEKKEEIRTRLRQFIARVIPGFDFATQKFYPDRAGDFFEGAMCQARISHQTYQGRVSNNVREVVTADPNWGTPL